MEHYIFGGPNGRKWDEKDWTASDDRVRGGKSISHITMTKTPDTGITVAKFSGNLDITTLGGAGFASHRTTIFEGDDQPLDLKGFNALVLKIVCGTSGGDGESDRPVRKYTVVLKDTILPKRPDGREQSTISWEADFNMVLEEDGSDTGKEKTITLPFEEFKPTYRGKPVEDGKAKLDWGGVKRVSLMVRSFFGDQYGPFSLVVSSIAARKTAEESGGWGCCVI
ncbi:putative complex I intermediate-associated protein 30 [Naviculisporaceae sp. PSN 640]